MNAAFNLNGLLILNRLLGADFDPSSFAHTVSWNPSAEHVEHTLRVIRTHTITLIPGQPPILLEPGEHLHTGISQKFRPDRLAGELRAAGLTLVDRWTDPGNRYMLVMTAPEH